MSTASEVLFLYMHNAGRSQRAANVVITMRCGDAWPVFTGKRYVDWGLPALDGRGVQHVQALLAEPVTTGGLRTRQPPRPGWAFP